MTDITTIKYKYIWPEYTMVQPNRHSVKVKVMHGETIMSSLPYEFMKSNRFIAINNFWKEMSPLEVDQSKESKEKKSIQVNSVKEVVSEVEVLPEAVKEVVPEYTLTIEEAKKYLNDNGIVFHHAAGLKKLNALVEEHKKTL